MLGEKFTELRHDAASKSLKASTNFPMIRSREGHEIEKIAQGLIYPASVALDNKGRMYVAEAGGTFLDEERASTRILLVEEGGRITEVVNRMEKFIQLSRAWPPFESNEPEMYSRWTFSDPFDRGTGMIWKVTKTD